MNNKHLFNNIRCNKNPNVCNELEKKNEEKWKISMEIHQMCSVT